MNITTSVPAWSVACPSSIALHKKDFVVKLAVICNVQH